MTRIMPSALRAVYSAFKNRLARSSSQAAFTGAVPPAAPVETSLQTLTRLILSGPDGEGNPAQSMVLKCGHYARAKLVQQEVIIKRIRMFEEPLMIDRCLVVLQSTYAPDQWHLAIFPFNGKADLYEGFVE